MFDGTGEKKKIQARREIASIYAREVKQKKEKKKRLEKGEGGKPCSNVIVFLFGFIASCSSKSPGARDAFLGRWPKSYSRADRGGRGTRADDGPGTNAQAGHWQRQGCDGEE